eukprot:403368211
MKKSFNEGVLPAYDMINYLLQQNKYVDPISNQNIFTLIQDLPGGLNFSLSWLLTWFSHDITDFNKVQRIFDVCLYDQIEEAMILYDKYPPQKLRKIIIDQQIAGNIVKQDQELLSATSPETFSTSPQYNDMQLLKQRSGSSLHR